jgi:hypothetical protein
VLPRGRQAPPRRLDRYTIVVVAAAAFVAGASPAAASSVAFPAGDLDDPGDLIAAELARANLLNDAAQLGGNLPLYGPAPTAADQHGYATVGVRARGSHGGGAVGGSVAAHFAQRSQMLAGDVQLSCAAIRPRGLEVVTTRDWAFNVQFRGGRAFGAAAEGGDHAWFVGAGLPFVASSGENWSFRALHDVVRWEHDAAGEQWRWNFLGGMMFSSGDLMSFSIDSGATEERGDWRVPLQAAVWVGAPRVAFGLGGGLGEITNGHTFSLGLAAVVSAP